MGKVREEALHCSDDRSMQCYSEVSGLNLDEFRQVIVSDIILFVLTKL